ncbi:MAG: CpaF family protein, partial [Lachnospiraceae bacterium]|nr:CpaF family protein [Lachnospiraceae bacterium]
MDKYKDVFYELREKLLDTLRERGDVGDDEIRSLIDDLVLSDAAGHRLSVSERLMLGRELFHSVRRLDILQELIDDKTVTEIMVNGPNTIYVEQAGRIRRWEKTFSSKEKLEDVI